LAQGIVTIGEFTETPYGIILELTQQRAKPQVNDAPPSVTSGAVPKVNKCHLPVYS
jgi:hypothetical protein